MHSLSQLGVKWKRLSITPSLVANGWKPRPGLRNLEDRVQPKRSRPLMGLRLDTLVKSKAGGFIAKADAVAQAKVAMAAVIGKPPRRQKKQKRSKKAV